jgi:hypothetical protein
LRLQIRMAHAETRQRNEMLMSALLAARAKRMTNRAIVSQ